jgi:ABC-type bacteriocin/lantibiotic exporter with double-glycine peptidase domain
MGRKSIIKSALPACIIIVILAVISSYISLYIPMVNKNIIDEGIAKSQMNLVIKFAIILVIVFAANSILKFISNGVTAQFGSRFISGLKRQAIQRIFKFSMSYFDKINSGELSQRIREIDGLSVFFSPTFLHIVVSIFSCVGGLITVLKIHPLIILFYIPIIPLVGFVSYKIASTYQNSLMKTIEMEGQASGLVQESIQGIAEVKSLNIQDKKEVEINEINSNVYKRTLWQNLFVSASSEILSFINIVLSTGITVLSASLIINKQMSIGDYFAVIQYTTLILAPAQLVSSAYISLQPGIACMKRVKTIYNTETEQIDGTNNIGTINEIHGKSISFSYSNNKPVLNNISFDIKKGQKLSILGPNGSGKTTLAKLLLGFYNNYEGEIYYNSQKLSDISLKSLRNEISVVFQEVFLFNGSLKENIRCAAPNATDDEILEALQQCGMISDKSSHESRMILFMPVMEGGKNLSGGQKRRIALARALIKKPSVLILDEATAHLDQETRLLLKDFLSKNLKDMIVIIITHDNDIAELADKTLLLTQTTTNK